MFALISPNETVLIPVENDGAWEYEDVPARIAQISETIFEVALPLFWVEVQDFFDTNCYYYNMTTKTITKIPATPDDALPYKEIPLTDLGAPQ